ncbi:hypothetical protein Bbelb_174330 [Branchiostoma belcheri]|nr:hypothetical protein Bbelb_174330 [Branchiostoma belcheri]
MRSVSGPLRRFVQTTATHTIVVIFLNVGSFACQHTRYPPIATTGLVREKLASAVARLLTGLPPEDHAPDDVRALIHAGKTCFSRQLGSDSQPSSYSRSRRKLYVSGVNLQANLAVANQQDSIQ